MSTAATSTGIAALLLLYHSAASAQVAAGEPRYWKSASSIGLGSSGFDLDRGLRDTVRAEILDTNTVDLIAQSIPLTEHERTLFQVAPDPAGEELWLYSLGDEWSEGCSRFASRLNAYVLARMDGHTRACLRAGLTNRTALATISDSDLRILFTNYPMLPVSLFHKAETGTTTNKAGQVTGRSLTATMVDGKLQLKTNYARVPGTDEICRWVSYTLVDQGIAWTYVLRFAVDGALDGIDTTKLDAKEIDPKFRKVMVEVAAEVTAEMKQNGTFGHLGAVHTYWRLKKEKLRARGVDWRSPGELNQGRIYD